MLCCLTKKSRLLWTKKGLYSFLFCFFFFSSPFHARNHLSVVWEDYFIRRPQRDCGRWKINLSAGQRKKRERAEIKNLQAASAHAYRSIQDLYSFSPWQRGHRGGVSLHLHTEGLWVGCSFRKKLIYIHSLVLVHTQPVKKNSHMLHWACHCKRRPSNTNTLPCS